MQDRTKDIRAAVGIVADDMRKELPEKAELATAFEFLLGNLLVDIHTIAHAQSKMANLEPWVDPLFKKGKGGKADMERG